MDLDKLQELMRLFEASTLSELEIEEEGRRVRFQKAVPAVPTPGGPGGLPASNPHHMAPFAQPLPPPPESREVEEDVPTIDSPMVGTFYVAPAPGEPPFVNPGDRVEAGQTVCIVEAMKLMNEVAAKFACTIEKVLVENGSPVEFGQPLFAVRPL